jgi:hypothetical protein
MLIFSNNPLKLSIQIIKSLSLIIFRNLFLIHHLFLNFLFFHGIFIQPNFYIVPLKFLIIFFDLHIYHNFLIFHLIYTTISPFNYQTVNYLNILNDFDLFHLQSKIIIFYHSFLK